MGGSHQSLGRTALTAWSLVIVLVSVSALLWRHASDSQRPGSRESGREIPVRLVDLNAAPAQELMLLPGIGPARAAAIERDRLENGTYASIDEIDRVRGIGPGTIEKLRAHAVVGPIGTTEAPID